MIRRLRLFNFQAWPEVDLPLSPITVIIGETNAGKSSLLRALASVLFNAFEGQGMVRQGATLAEVELELEEGSVIRWARGNGVNRYTLDGHLLDKPGRAVPAAVQDALQIRELEFDGEVVRLQWAPQMDAPFLLSDSGAKATRMLGVAGNAAVVAQANRLAQQETRQEQDALRASETQLAQLRQQLESFADVVAAEPMAADLRATLRNYDDLKARRAVVQELSDIQDKLGPAKALLQQRQLTAQHLAHTSRHLTRLLETRKWMSDGRAAQARVQALQARLALADGLKDAWTQVCRLEDMRRELEASHATFMNLAATQERLAQAKDRLDACRVVYDAEVSALTCPACGRLKDAA